MKSNASGKDDSAQFGNSFRKVSTIQIYEFGLNLFSSSELLTTMTELVAIAPAARNGRIPYTPVPKNGTSAPAAIGMSPML
jgi:hypothetical protein